MFRLLGPVQFGCSGSAAATASPDLGPAKQRLVLAALLADAGRPVTRATLIDRVWGEEPAADAGRVLYTYVNRIRRTLERLPGNESGDPTAVLIRQSGGYLLDMDPDQVDVHRFRRLVAAARQRPAPDRERAALLREALDLFHGEPLAGLSGSWAERIRQGWQQQRVDVTVDWAAAELALGHADAAIGPVRELLMEFPLTETLTVVLMRALVAAGREAEALQCYASTRSLLVEELGAEPGAELRALHESVLRGQATSFKAPASPPAPIPVPAQLPADIAAFAGRAAALRQLDALLPAAGSPPAVVVIAVSGTAGVGKTALCVHWAHRIADRFPDGQLYVNLRGFDPGDSATDPAEALRGFLDALWVSPGRIPAGLDAQAALFRSVVAGRRMLIVLDNARDAEQVRPLLPGAPGCLVVVTGRTYLAGLIAGSGAHSVQLDLLSVNEAREVLARRLGARRVAADQAATDEIIDLCARLPLALAVAAARAAGRPDVPLALLAEQMREARGGLEAFAEADAATNLRAVFSWSYRKLSAAAARLFRLLSVHSGPDVSLAAIASLTGWPLEQARRAAGELVDAHLLAEHRPGRYTWHDLLRAFASELASTMEPADERRAAVERVVGHYLHTAYTANRRMHPHRVQLTLVPAPAGVAPEEVGDHDDAVAWFTAEHRVLLDAVRLAADHRLDGQTWQLAWTLVNYLDRSGHWRDMADSYEYALEATTRLGDPAAQARAHSGLAHAATSLWNIEEGELHYRAALERFAAVDDLVGQAQTLLNLGGTVERNGRAAEALGYAEQALQILVTVDDKPGIARALNAIGWYQALLGRYEETIVHCGQALAVYVEIDHRTGRAAALDSLGYAHHHLGQHAEAIDCYQQALELNGGKDLNNEQDLLTHIGDAYYTLGAFDAAKSVWQRALEILIELDRPEVALRERLDRLAGR
jgi:DNA-binding SARP family transcriptional activator/tetratricopeptide (TPR) repeat protein